MINFDTPRRLALLNALAAHGYRVKRSIKLPDQLNANSLKSELLPNLVQSNSFLLSLYSLLFLFGREVNMALVPLGGTALVQCFTLLARPA